METSTKVAIGGTILLAAGLYFTFVHKNSGGMTLAQRIRLKNVPGRTAGADGYTERQDEGNTDAVLAKAGFNAAGAKCGINRGGSNERIKRDKYHQELHDMKKAGYSNANGGSANHGFTLS